jgi:hypothetical protein
MPEAGHVAGDNGAMEGRVELHNFSRDSESSLPTALAALTWPRGPEKCFGRERTQQVIEDNKEWLNSLTQAEPGKPKVKPEKPAIEPATRSVLRSNGLNDLTDGLETSGPGLHMLGAPAARSFGPLRQFVSDTHCAYRSLTRHIAAIAWRHA